MNIGAITKQLASEALGSAMKEVIDGPPPPPEISPDNVSALILNQVQAMQAPMKDDLELVVTCTCGPTTIRVHDIFAPSPKLLVITGTIEGERGPIRIITPAEAAQLVARPMPVKQGAKPLRLRFILPKPKA